MSAIEAMVLPFLIVFASWILSDHSIKADDNHKDIGSQDLSNIVISIDNHLTPHYTSKTVVYDLSNT